MADDTAKSTAPYLAEEGSRTQKVNQKPRHAQSIVEASLSPQIKSVRTGINGDDAILAGLGQTTDFSKMAQQPLIRSSDGSVSKSDLETGRANTALQTHNQNSPIFGSGPHSQDGPAQGSYSGMSSLQPSDPVLNGYRNAFANGQNIDLERSKKLGTALDHNQQARVQHPLGHPRPVSKTTHAIVSDVLTAITSQEHNIPSRVVPQKSENIAPQSEIQNLTTSQHRPVLKYQTTIGATSDAIPTSKLPTQSDLEDPQSKRSVTDNSGAPKIQETAAGDNVRPTRTINGFPPQSTGLNSAFFAHSNIRQAPNLTPSVADEDGGTELSVAKSRHGAQSTKLQQHSTETKSNLNLDQSHFSNALGIVDRSRTSAKATDSTRNLDLEKSAAHTFTSDELQQLPLAAKQTGAQQSTKLAASFTSHTAGVPQPSTEALSGLQLQTILDESSENELIQVQTSDQTRGASVAANHIPVKAGIPQHIPKQLAEIIQTTEISQLISR